MSTHISEPSLRRSRRSNCSLRPFRRFAARMRSIERSSGRKNSSTFRPIRSSTGDAEHFRHSGVGVRDHAVFIVDPDAFRRGFHQLPMPGFA